MYKHSYTHIQLIKCKQNCECAQTYAIFSKHMDSVVMSLYHSLSISSIPQMIIVQNDNRSSDIEQHMFPCLSQSPLLFMTFQNTLWLNQIQSLFFQNKPVHVSSYNTTGYLFKNCLLTSVSNFFPPQCYALTTKQSYKDIDHHYLGGRWLAECYPRAQTPHPSPGVTVC